MDFQAKYVSCSICKRCAYNSLYDMDYQVSWPESTLLVWLYSRSPMIPSGHLVLTCRKLIDPTFYEWDRKLKLCQVKYILNISLCILKEDRISSTCDMFTRIEGLSRIVSLPYRVSTSIVVYINLSDCTIMSSIYWL